MNQDNTEILKAYTENKFTERRTEPEPEETYSDTWQLWLKKESPCEILNTHIIPRRPVEFLEPDEVKIMIHASYAGNIPLVILGNDSDFENFIVNASCHGERPDNISQMGASFMYGKRIRMLVLSKKFYSNTPAERVNLSREEWRNKSMILRLEHETVHYYTKRYYGTASNNIHDELIADFFGMRKAFGNYDAGLFMYFMGIDGSHEGRLSLYTSGMNEDVKNKIAEIARRCALFLERNQKEIKDSPLGIDDLCKMGLHNMCQFAV